MASTARPPRPRVHMASTAWRALALVSVAIVAAAVVVVALIGFSTGSSHKLSRTFPVFGKTSTDASGFLTAVLRDQGVVDAKADARHARAIATPVGTGYVVTDNRADLICIATPSFAGDLASDCSTVDQAKLHGIAAPKAYDKSDHAVAWTAVLPSGATATLRDARGRAAPMSATNGVLSVVVHQLSFVTITINGHATTTALATQSECDPVTQRGPACRAVASAETQS